MAAEPTVVHYLGDGPDAYAEALLRLVRHARASADDFTFGPLRLADAERDGLAVGGPDLVEVLALLSTVPGLVAQTAPAPAAGQDTVSMAQKSDASHGSSR